MKYLCLVYGDENAFHDLPDHPEDAECHAYDVAIAESGRGVAAEALQPTRASAASRSAPCASSTPDRVRPDRCTARGRPRHATRLELGSILAASATRSIPVGGGDNRIERAS